jgi:hypothetical protein
VIVNDEDAGRGAIRGVIGNGHVPIISQMGERGGWFE